MVVFDCGRAGFWGLIVCFRRWCIVTDEGWVLAVVGCGFGGLGLVVIVGLVFSFEFVLIVAAGGGWFGCFSW